MNIDLIYYSIMTQKIKSFAKIGVLFLKALENVAKKSKKMNIFSKKVLTNADQSAKMGAHLFFEQKRLNGKK